MPWREYKYTGNGDEIILVADERAGWLERTVVENENIMEATWKRCEGLVDSWNDQRGKAFSPMDIEPLKGIKKV
jgi:hypothetical protein